MSAILMRGVLDQIQAQATQIAGQTRSAATPEEKNISFSNALIDSISQINKTQLDAKDMTQKWMSGESDIGLNDVMLSMQKSSISFSFGMQARNKMISAYQEIMNTPV